MERRNVPFAFPFQSEKRRGEKNSLRRNRKSCPKREKANLISQTGLYLCRQLPTLPHTFARSTIGPAGLNFRVRDGNGWNPRGKITDNLEQLLATSSWLLARPGRCGLPCIPATDLRCKLVKEREDEASQLNRLGENRD
jgi:hypothetical protein